MLAAAVAAASARVTVAVGIGYIFFVSSCEYMASAWSGAVRLICEENEYRETDSWFYFCGAVCHLAACATDAPAGCCFAGVGAGCFQAADRDQYDGFGGEYDAGGGGDAEAAAGC